MSRRRRTIEVFSLSFLDAICCGFGAVILLFVMSRVGESDTLEEVPIDDLSGIVRKLEAELFEIRGQTATVNREVTAVREQVSEHKENIARLQGDISQVKGEFAASKQDSEVQNAIEGRLAVALQTLTDEMRALYRQQPRKRDNSVGGIPIDSEYIIFIIDTSGSMNEAWPLLLKKIDETLSVYPKVEGIQIMNDMGVTMFQQYANRWIPDTPARREAMLRALRGWRPFSNSSPVEGIEQAIRTFYDKGRKISLYVFGDEYSGRSMQAVVDTVDRINVPGADGRRLVRIHAVGFPTMIQHERMMHVTGISFAALMRALCERHGGTFVALNSHAQ